MSNKIGNRFSFNNYRTILSSAKSSGYKVLNCIEYFESLESLPEKYIILRHDIEHYPERALRFAEIESDLGFKSTFFVRVHSNTYNVFGHKCQYLLRKIKSLGHEIGLHTEAIDFSKISNRIPSDVFREEIELLEKAIDCKIEGVCPHVDWTEYNNQSIFEEIDITRYDLKYNAYASVFFKDNYYISDGQHYYWKNYRNGILVAEALDPVQAINKEISGIYVLTHPLNWFENEYHLM